MQCKYQYPDGEVCGDESCEGHECEAAPAVPERKPIKNASWKDCKHPVFPGASKCEQCVAERKPEESAEQMWKDWPLPKGIASGISLAKARILDTEIVKFAEAFAEHKCKELEEADTQRVKDISRLTTERDDARESRSRRSEQSRKG